MSTEPAQVTLDQLPIGVSGSIVRLGGAKATKRRLMDMGLVRGEVVRVEHVAPLGDPIALRVKGYRLSMRKREARHITVAPASSGAGART